jgi:hypothetical protein
VLKQDVATEVMVPPPPPPPVDEELPQPTNAPQSVSRRIIEIEASRR